MWPANTATSVGRSRAENSARIPTKKEPREKTRGARARIRSPLRRKLSRRVVTQKCPHPLLIATIFVAFKRGGGVRVEGVGYLKLPASRKLQAISYKYKIVYY